MKKIKLKQLILDVLNEETKRFVNKTTFKKDTLPEMAYPASFSMEQFNAIKTYKGKMQYANQHLQKLANGSSRTIFKIDDEKVLKLAKNEKGLAQNNIETDFYLSNHTITANIFESDSLHDRPYWLEMEFAKKLTPTRFKAITGFTLDEIYLFLNYIANNKEAKITPELKEKIHDNEFVNNLEDMAISMDMPIPGDLARLSTYGEVIRDGKPTVVVIDYGLTKDVFNNYYAR